jgi:uncharacterized membrane protein HdeD (DUF308 family)
LADALRRNWVALLLRGFFTITFGVTALLLAQANLGPLWWPLGIYAIVDGILGLGIAIGENSARPHWLVLLFRALTGVVVGVLVLVLTRPARLPFLWYLGIWLVCGGVLDILTAHFLLGKLGVEWFLGVGGAAAVVSGVVLLPWWGAGNSLLGRVITVNFLLIGVLLVIVAFRARTARLR